MNRFRMLVAVPDEQPQMTKINTRQHVDLF